MSRGRVGVYLGVAILVVALIWGRGLDAGERSNPGGHGYLIRNASVVLTMDPTLGHGILGQIENADVLIVGDRIAAVGSLGRRPPGVQEIDGRGMIVMPGFVDTHDHLWQSVIRGCAVDANVDGWFTRCGSPLFQYRFSESDAYAIVRLSTTGLIGTGVTTVVDWSHAFNADFVRGNLLALNDSGLRYAFAMGVPTASDGPDVKAAKAEFIDPNPLGTLQVAGRVSVTPGVLKEEIAVAKELGVKLHIHLLESPDKKDGDSFQILQDAGALALGRDLLFAHVIHLSPADLAKLVETGAAVSHQPLSNMRLASGIMRYPEMQSAGIRIGLGLDGGTNDTVDVFNNMRAAVGLQRALAAGPLTSPTVEQVLRAATMGGAEVLDMQGTIGSLSPGKQADVIVIDTRAVNFAPVLRPVAQLVFNGQPQNVQWVFVAGRALMENGKVKGVNQRKLIEEAQAASDRITRLHLLKP